MNVSGQAAIVTGGHSGMGFAAAQALVAKGCKVSIIGRRASVVEEQARRIGAYPITCDVSDGAAVEAAVEEAEAKHGVARVLVNAAATGQMYMLLSPNGAPSPLAPLREIIDCNLLGTLYINRAFAGRLTRTLPLENNLRGVIVNVSSIGAADGVVGVAYAASKGGVDAIGLSLARELSAWRIRVVTISPGGIDTEMLRAGAVDGTYEALRTMVPALGRAGRPEEFGSLALHICENDYLNGCNIRLDGGMRIPFSFALSREATEPMA
jgi:NAD(P)-dependent dehydrogenase (short-subunit alcohol dehydrogenase family)